MKYADVNLYIVRHMYSKKKMLSIANTLFETKRVNNLNIIINDFQSDVNSVLENAFKNHRMKYEGSEGNLLDSSENQGDDVPSFISDYEKKKNKK